MPSAPGFSCIEYYHNSSFLEHGGSPDKAVRSAFVSAIDAHLKDGGKYNKNESKVTFADVADCLVLISQLPTPHAPPMKTRPKRPSTTSLSPTA